MHYQLTKHDRRQIKALPSKGQYKMKYILVFLAGLVCGMGLLLQVQRTAFAAEIQCLNAAERNGTLTKQSCKAESDWLEFVQML